MTQNVLMERRTTDGRTTPKQCPPPTVAGGGIMKLCPMAAQILALPSILTLKVKDQSQIPPKFYHFWVRRNIFSYQVT